MNFRFGAGDNMGVTCSLNGEEEESSVMFMAEGATSLAVGASILAIAALY